MIVAITAIYYNKAKQGSTHKYTKKGTDQRIQGAKKVLSDSPGLVDFAIGLVNFVFNFPDGQVNFYEEFE